MNGESTSAGSGFDFRSKDGIEGCNVLRLPLRSDDCRFGFCMGGRGLILPVLEKGGISSSWDGFSFGSRRREVFRVESFSKKGPDLDMFGVRPRDCRVEDGLFLCFGGSNAFGLLLVMHADDCFGW